MARLIFIDETSTNTKLTKRTGWSAKGQRYRTHAPFGSWKSQTFIAGLRCHGLTAPWIVDAPMNGRIFETWIETQLAPTLSPGEVVILDNVAFHKTPRAEELVRARGAWLLFLPAYSPDLNPCMDGSCESRIRSVPVNRSVAAMYTASDMQRDCCAP
ncbi:transposase [Neorhizobium sp. DAR64861/K0K2]|uniref:transposase n=1 Tax=unclassified Neorhizobium TaxID=2629175 RepID=UPI003D2BB657